MAEKKVSPWAKPQSKQSKQSKAEYLSSCGLILTQAALNTIAAESDTESAAESDRLVYRSHTVLITEPFDWRYDEEGPFYFVPLQPSTITSLARASYPDESPSDTILRIIAKHKGVH